MIDDLTKKGLEEPYRLFTSRAEYRLLLGVDTVLPRLLPHGRRLGLISDAEYGEAMESEIAPADGGGGAARADLQSEPRHEKPLSRKARDRARNPDERV